MKRGQTIRQKTIKLLNATLIIKKSINTLNNAGINIKKEAYDFFNIEFRGINGFNFNDGLFCFPWENKEPTLQEYTKFLDFVINKYNKQ